MTYNMKEYYTKEVAPALQRRSVSTTSWKSHASPR
jgi:hypothetical protein